MCGYPEVVTLQNLPAFAVHNQVSNDFTIPQNSELSILGEYTANIKSMISVPDDYQKVTFTNWFVEYQFQIYIEPCLVDTYISMLNAGPISYRIGDPTLTDGPYIFTENPICNYPETVTLSNFPTWVTHNSATADFTIPMNGDLSLIGEYVVTIKSLILVPTDYTNSAFTTMAVEYPFSLFIEPCIITDFTTTPSS